MPRWLSSKKVETVRALLAGALPSATASTAHVLIVCPCRVRRGPGDAVRVARFLTISSSPRNPLIVVRSLRESLGISADGSEKAFHTTDIDAMMKRVPDPIYYNVREPTQNVNHVFVACDPSGGGASAFSVASLVQDVRGFSHVRCSRLANSRFLGLPSTQCTAWTPAPQGCPAFAPCR